MNLPDHCRGTSRSGAPCRMRSNLNPENGLCLVHDPERAEEFRTFARAGQQRAVAARKENRKIRAATLADVLERPPVGDSLETLATFHRWVIEATARGDLELGVSRTHTAAVRVQQQVYEKRDLMRQLRDLEKAYDELKRRHMGRER